ncbi:MAG: ANTAR domain-containing protein [Ruminococcus sp.]|uniref:ANTAR domain-containing response regulator n=1 Tax=Ruminococcus sp. TaxID=41978 RepID=UPI001B0DE319|nr:ANTAR domain-containing protein [Ruminococcus sp.]MBO7472385.1 ANTAR domain-containing protein [Ruminococcus sp.]MBP1591464.1 ANTAR domain-containing protein [Oscillospiraceae bacterium]
MEKVLVISSNKNASEALINFLRDSFRCTPKLVESAYQAKTYLDVEPSVELTIINSPLMDESGFELAEYIIEKTAANCIFMIKDEHAEKINDNAEKNGIIVIGKPFSRTLLYQLVKTIDIAVNRSLKLYRENLRLEEKIAEIQAVDKAKFMLMQYKGMTEEEAHSYLEQYAMNKRKKKSLAALAIIDKLSEQYL